MLWKTSLLLCPAIILTGCFSASHTDRGAAFNACNSGDTASMSRCVERKMADRQSDCQRMASAYQEKLQACEDRRTEAAARGAGADAISCPANLADYTLGNIAD